MTDREPTEASSSFAFAIQEHTVALWIIAAVFYGVGDVGTTAIGLASPGVVEAGPVAGPLFRRFGFDAMLALKAALFAVGYAFWRLVPKPAAVGVPLGLGALGILVFVWNSTVLIRAHPL